MSKKTKIMIGIGVAAVLIAALTIAAIFLLPKLKDPQTETIDSPEKVITIAMDALIEGGTEKTVLLGADGTPVSISAPEGLAGVISSKISYSLLSMEVSDHAATATLQIQAPDTLDLATTALAGMESFEESVFLERMEDLLQKDHKTVSNTVQVEMVLVKDQWCLVTNTDLSDAITGGLISRYVQLQEAIMDALKKEDAQ